MEPKTTEPGHYVVEHRREGAVYVTTIANELLQRLLRGVSKTCPLFSHRLKECGYDWLLEVKEIQPKNVDSCLQQLYELAPDGSIEKALKQCGDKTRCDKRKA